MYQKNNESNEEISENNIIHSKKIIIKKNYFYI